MFNETTNNLNLGNEGKSSSETWKTVHTYLRYSLEQILK